MKIHNLNQKNNSVGRNLPNTALTDSGSGATIPLPAEQVVAQKKLHPNNADQSVDASLRRVSSRPNKGQTPSRFATSGYLLYVCLIILFICISVIDAIPVSPWSESDGDEKPLIDNNVLWHPWERAILLSGYQFLIVSYKVLPPKTSSGKFLCGGTYNATEIPAPTWYIEWENEIDILTNRALNVTSRTNTRREKTTIRHSRDTRPEQKINR